MEKRSDSPIIGNEFLNELKQAPTHRDNLVIERNEKLTIIKSYYNNSN